MKKQVILHIRGIMAILLAAAWLTACENDKEPENAENAGLRALLEKNVESGNLLSGIAREEGRYIFHFEIGSIEIPVTDISDIREDAEHWITVITFPDQTDFYIPSLGNSLDRIIKKITLNPGGCSPLAASVEVFLPAKGRIRVVVHGKKDSNGTLEHLFRSTDYKQEIPVLGLYPDYKNKVDLIFTDNNGRERRRSQIEIQTGPLQLNYFPVFLTKTAQPGRMEPGVTLVSYPGQSETDTSCPYMIDADGEIRWILTLDQSAELTKLGAQIGVQRMKNGNFICGDTHKNRLVEMDMLGNLIREWDLAALGYSFHHEAKEAANGNFLVTVSKASARLANGNARMNDHIIELDPKSGTVVTEWDLATMLDTARYQIETGGAGFGQTAANWAHNNSIGEYNGAFIATARFQGIVKFGRNGKLDWVISPHKNWGASFRNYLLTPLDRNGQPVTDPRVVSGETGCDDFDWAWGMHTPVIMPNGNILVFDNGYFRNFEAKTLYDEGTYSRVVEYKVNESQKTVQQVWEYGRERGRACYAPALSGVQYLPETGHILFCPGIANKTTQGYGGHVIEIDPETKEIIYELEITAPSLTAFHRATRISLYPENL